MTPAQCRAARALVEMTQGSLATKANVGLSTIRNFETGRSIPYSKNMADIVSALERAGVEFIAGNGSGPGVRLARPTKTKRK